jgi:hypothetical protein
MPGYQQLSRDEVLRLVLEKDQLTDEARLALEAEVARRGLSHDDFADFKSDEAAALRERQKEIERATPRQTYKEFRGGVRTIATMQDFESRSSIPHCES